MIICDNCNVCVTKPTFCKDSCRVQYHRAKALRISKDKLSTPQEIPTKVIKVDKIIKGVPKIDEKFIDKSKSILFE